MRFRIGSGALNCTLNSVLIAEVVVRRVGVAVAVELVIVRILGGRGDAEIEADVVAARSVVSLQEVARALVLEVDPREGVPNVRVVRSGNDRLAAARGDRYVAGALSAAVVVESLARACRVRVDDDVLVTRKDRVGKFVLIRLRACRGRGVAAVGRGSRGALFEFAAAGSLAGTSFELSVDAGSRPDRRP